MKQMIREQQVLELNNFNFRIPLYQRPYAWGEDEIIQLLEDLKLFQEKENNSYFLGNIVVSKKDNIFDIIDGQQRLTTLYLIVKILKKEKIFDLEYEIREEDRKFLKEWLGNVNFPDNINPKFMENIKAIFSWKKNNEDKFKTILENVVVTITEIPGEVDVVKYFEVMNNRGRQLEKHEILKANFLDVLKEDKESIDYAKIWDYCSAMDSSIEDLIYYNDFEKREKNSEEGFKKLRDDLLKTFFHKKFEINSQNGNELKIIDIIEPPIEKQIKGTNEKEISLKHSYRSIVKFPIFLIQVLKMFKAKKNKEIDKIIVNDRYLLDYFYGDKQHTQFIFNEKEAKEFLKFMLKIRILFDYFIFKRDLDKQEKAVFLPFVGETNKEILMIELLFNVSAPQYFSQDWIVIFLSKLDQMFKNGANDKNKIKNVIKFLEEFDEELAKIRLSEKKILDFINEKLQNIYQYPFKDKNIDFNINLLENLLNQGTSTPHYWFYKLDYLLWKDLRNKKKIWKDINVLENVNVENFRLSRLNSIEHIFPQNPEKYCGEWDDDKCKRDNFGNLVLISQHLNSSFSNQCFEDKKDDLRKQLRRNTIQSLKMLLIYSKYNNLDENICKEHYQEMMEILKNHLI